MSIQGIARSQSNRLQSKLPCQTVVIFVIQSSRLRNRPGVIKFWVPIIIMSRPRARAQDLIG